MNKLVGRPFLRWVGGKQKSLNQLKLYFPKDLFSYDTYIEPFIGGGTIFFYIAQNYDIKNKVIIDSNKDLILTYKVLRDKPLTLLDSLSSLNDYYLSMSSVEKSEFYYKVRKEFNEQRLTFNYDANDDNEVLRSTMFIFLNKTAYGGLHRLNMSGDYNSPYSTSSKPHTKILNISNLLACSNVLQNTMIECGDYMESYKHIYNKTFMYLDPPYRPQNVNSFTKYNGYSFTEDDQLKLAGYCNSIKDNVHFMLSNSDPQNNDLFFSNNYSYCNINKTYSPRGINSNPKGRGIVSELVITNY